MKRINNEQFLCDAISMAASVYVVQIQKLGSCVNAKVVGIIDTDDSGTYIFTVYDGIEFDSEDCVNENAIKVFTDAVAESRRIKTVSFAEDTDAFIK